MGNPKVERILDQLHTLWVQLQGEGFAESAALVMDIERRVRELTNHADTEENLSDPYGDCPHITRGYD